MSEDDTAKSEEDTAKLPPGRYVWNGEDFVPKDEYVRPKPEGPYIQSDLAEYISPVTKKPVDGRAARREDLKRAGAREVDPSEFTPKYTTDQHERSSHERRRYYSFKR